MLCGSLDGREVWGRMDTCICMAESLRCSPETITALLISCTAIQNAKFKNNNFCCLSHGTTDWFQIGKGVRQGCILSPCLFNLYTEYIMRNTGLEEAQAGIKIAGRNINNLRYADDTILMAESEELESLDESEGGEWNSWLKAQHSENKIMASGPITSWRIDGETMETVTDFIFWLQNLCRWWLQP